MTAESFLSSTDLATWDTLSLIFGPTFYPAREQRPEATDAAFSSNGNQADYKLVRQDIAELINVNPAKGPTLVRLAWHSSGTYSKILKDGGSSKGTIRFKEELQHEANAGLDTATMWLEPIYKKVGMDFVCAFKCCSIDKMSICSNSCDLQSTCHINWMLIILYYYTSHLLRSSIVKQISPMLICTPLRAQKLSALWADLRLPGDPAGWTV